MQLICNNDIWYIYICVWYASYIYTYIYIYNYITYVSNFQHMCHCQNAVSGYGHIPSWESLQWVSKSLLGWWPSLSPTWASFPSFDNDRLLCILSSCLILSCPNSQLSIYRILVSTGFYRLHAISDQWDLSDFSTSKHQRFAPFPQAAIHELKLAVVALTKPQLSVTVTGQSLSAAGRQAPQERPNSYGKPYCYKSII